MKDECRYRNSMSYAINQRFDCAYKTLATVYSLLLFYNKIAINQFTLRLSTIHKNLMIA